MIWIARCCRVTISGKLQTQRLAFSTYYFDKKNSSYATNIIKDSEDTNNEESFDKDRPDDEFVDSVMTHSLKYVNTHGWSMDAIIAGASDVTKQKDDLNTVELATSLFSEDDLVRFFINKSNIQMETFLIDNKVSYRDALEYRLNKVVPYAERYSEAIALSTQPKNIAYSLQQLQEIADSIAHHALSDKSTDISWYSKRIGLASIYASTELCLVQDKSENYGETWSFLRRRCQDFENMKLNVNSQSKALPLPEFFAVGVTTILNMLQRNARR